MSINDKNQRVAISLFSGGLDSILASRVIAAQGIKVYAVKFISPFFDYHLLAREKSYQREVKEKYGIDVLLKDISLDYIEMLKKPQHGYGKHFNPCVDCKIFMVSKAREMMAELNASFLITGEVIGQRPMSQRRDTLMVIERDSGCRLAGKNADRQARAGAGILLRPLCAKNLTPTLPEIEGIVDRELLHGFSGRGRTAQINLAREFGIDDYPNPAGGCILTDPIVSKRIATFYKENDHVGVADMRFIMVGRQFRLPNGGWLVMGRKASENTDVVDLRMKGDVLLRLVDKPGPTALLRNMTDRADLELAAGLVVRYGKKGKDGKTKEWPVRCSGGVKETLTGKPPEDSYIEKLTW